IGLPRGVIRAPIFRMGLSGEGPLRGPHSVAHWSGMTSCAETRTATLIAGQPIWHPPRLRSFLGRPRCDEMEEVSHWGRGWG
ncbi:MAG: hypothetical protein AAF292_17040, partial [Pseudomonadota bacterium]